MLFAFLHSSCSFSCLSLCCIVKMRCQSVQIQLCHFASQQFDLSHSTLGQLKTNQHPGVFLFFFVCLERDSLHINHQEFTVKAESYLGINVPVVYCHSYSQHSGRLLREMKAPPKFFQNQKQTFPLCTAEPGLCWRSVTTKWCAFCVHSQPHAFVLPSVITAQHWQRCHNCWVCQTDSRSPAAVETTHWKSARVLLSQACVCVCVCIQWSTCLCNLPTFPCYSNATLVAKCPGSLAFFSFLLNRVAMWARVVTMQYLFLCKHNTVSSLGMEKLLWSPFMTMATFCESVVVIFPQICLECFFV